MIPRCFQCSSLCTHKPMVFFWSARLISGHSIKRILAFFSCQSYQNWQALSKCGARAGQIFACSDRHRLSHHRRNRARNHARNQIALLLLNRPIVLIPAWQLLLPHCRRQAAFYIRHPWINAPPLPVNWIVFRAECLKVPGLAYVQLENMKVGIN